VSHETHPFYCIFGGMRTIFSSDLLSLMTAWSVLSMLVTWFASNYFVIN